MLEKAKVVTYNLIREDDDNTTAANVFDGVIVSLIILSSLSIILDTFNMPPWYAGVFLWFERFTAVVFTLEYLARIWTASLKYPQLRPWRARLKYALTPLPLIDLLSILPFYLPAVLPVDLRVLRLLRIIRLFRLFKVGRYTHALGIIQAVFRRKASQLISSMFTVGLLLIIASVLMFGLENNAQPGVFKNALDGLWWALSSITSANYGDIYPITLAGKLLGGLVALLGIGLIAVPTGIISAGFVEVVAEENPYEPPPTDPTIPDEIAQYKHLVDIGAITPEEYEAKKQQLLALEKP